jgi:hypothetical protein
VGTGDADVVERRPGDAGPRMDADCSRGAGSSVKIINIVLLTSQFEHSTTSGTLSALFFDET